LIGNLREQISLLKDANIQYRKETINLTKALKGDLKCKEIGRINLERSFRKI
jgi:hypothetical protein